MLTPSHLLNALTNNTLWPRNKWFHIRVFKKKKEEEVFEFVCRRGCGVSCGRAIGGPKGQFNRSCTCMHQYSSLWDYWERWWPLTLCFMHVWKRELPFSAKDQMGSENCDKGRQFVRLVVFSWMWEMGLSSGEAVMCHLGPYSPHKNRKKEVFFTKNTKSSCAFFKS